MMTFNFISFRITATYFIKLYLLLIFTAFNLPGKNPIVYLNGCKRVRMLRIFSLFCDIVIGRLNISESEIDFNVYEFYKQYIITTTLKNNTRYVVVEILYLVLRDDISKYVEIRRPCSVSKRALQSTPRFGFFMLILICIYALHFIFMIMIYRNG